MCGWVGGWGAHGQAVRHTSGVCVCVCGGGGIVQYDLLPPLSSTWKDLILPIPPHPHWYSSSTALLILPYCPPPPPACLTVLPPSPTLAKPYSPTPPTVAKPCTLHLPHLVAQMDALEAGLDGTPVILIQVWEGVGL